MAHQDTGKIFKTLNPNKVWIPVVFGLGIVGYLFYSDPNVSAENLALILNAKPGTFMLALTFQQCLVHQIHLAFLVYQNLSFQN